MCLQNIVDPQFAALSKETCNDLVTSMVVHHDLGNNQTMIKLARDYLKKVSIVPL